MINTFLTDDVLFDEYITNWFKNTSDRKLRILVENYFWWNNSSEDKDKLFYHELHYSVADGYKSPSVLRKAPNSQWGNWYGFMSSEGEDWDKVKDTILSSLKSACTREDGCVSPMDYASELGRLLGDFYCDVVGNHSCRYYLNQFDNKTVMLQDGFFPKCTLGGAKGIPIDWLDWNNHTVPEVAKSIYCSRDYSPMRILADALEEAGVTNEEIISHCRSDIKHSMGCWVLDLILNKK